MPVRFTLVCTAEKGRGDSAAAILSATSSTAATPRRRVSRHISIESEWKFFPNFPPFFSLLSFVLFSLFLRVNRCETKRIVASNTGEGWRDQGIWVRERGQESGIYSLIVLTLRYLD